MFWKLRCYLKKYRWLGEVFDYFYGVWLARIANPRERVPEDYLYSSARNYADMKGVLEVEVLPQKVQVVR